MMKKALLAVAVLALAVPTSAFAAKGAEGTQIKVIESKDYITDNASTNEVTPDWAWDAPYVSVTSTNSTHQGSGTLLTKISNTSSSTVTYNYQITKSYTNSFTANVGVTAQVVTAGVGFSTSATYTVQETISFSVPANSTRSLWIAPLGTQKKFNVYLANCCSPGHYLAGSGNAVNWTGKKYSIV